jgi:hypothetical protein
MISQLPTHTARAAERERTKVAGLSMLNDTSHKSSWW